MDMPELEQLAKLMRSACDVLDSMRAWAQLYQDSYERSNLEEMKGYKRLLDSGWAVLSMHLAAVQLMVEHRDRSA